MGVGHEDRRPNTLKAVRLLSPPPSRRPEGPAKVAGIPGPYASRPPAPDLELIDRPGAGRRTPPAPRRSPIARAGARRLQTRRGRAAGPVAARRPCVRPDSRSRDAPTLRRSSPAPARLHTDPGPVRSSWWCREETARCLLRRHSTVLFAFRLRHYRRVALVANRL